MKPPKPKDNKSCTNCKYIIYLRTQLGYTPICKKRSDLKRGKISVITPDMELDALMGCCRYWSDNNEQEKEKSAAPAL